MIQRRPKFTPFQDELPLASVRSHSLFPGRSLLTVAEVAQAWGVSIQHVINLIEVGDLAAIDIRTSKPVAPGTTHKMARAHYRVPVSEYDKFVTNRDTRTFTK